MYYHFKEDKKKLGTILSIKSGHTTISLGDTGLTRDRVVQLVKTVFKTATDSSNTIELLDEFADVQIKAFYYYNYKHLSYKQKKSTNTQNNRKFTLDLSKASRDILDAVEENKTIMTFLNKTRDVIDMPPDVMYPQSLVDYIVEFSSKNGIKVLELYNEKRLKKEGLNGVLDVGKGSHNQPRMAILEYDGTSGTNGTSGSNNSTNSEPIVLVGKGVTYDSGGYSIKSSGHMKNMKHDKTGVIIILGVLGAIAKLKLNCRVVAILPIAENMISDKSYKPDEIVKSHSGLSVEIFNTDAEGRLLLMDGISMAYKYNPKAIIDVATLTGVGVFCGKYGAIFGNHMDLAWTLQKIADKQGDPFWVMPPLDEFIDDTRNSSMANVKNEGYSCSSITMMAAAFLQNFAHKDVPWIHIDLGDSKNLYEKYDNNNTAKSNSFLTLVYFLKSISSI
jgi:leucyl aminopeptidase